MPLPDWTRIDTVFIDMDGTLLDLHFDNHFWREYLPARYAEREGIGPEEARERLEALYARVAGTLDWYCLDYWREITGLDIVALKRELAGLIAVRPHADAFLRALGASGRRRVLLSNAHPDSLRLKMDVTGIEPLLDALISTHRLGLAKETPGFWERLQDLEAFTPERTLLIDDDPTILEAAARAGIAQLLAIARPDSRRPALAGAAFPLVEDFREILPPRDQTSV